MITIKVNGASHQLDVEDDTPLLWVLREEIGLTGTKFGCGIALAAPAPCTSNGEAMRSCSVPIGSVDGAEITTIEGLSPDSRHPVQQAWLASRCRNAATASPARSWRRRPFSRPIRTRPTPTSMPTSPTFAVAAPMSGCAAPSIALQR